MDHIEGAFWGAYNYARVAFLMSLLAGIHHLYELLQITLIWNGFLILHSGTKTTWLWLGKDPDLSQNNFIKAGGALCHGWSNNHLGNDPGLKKPTSTVSRKQVFWFFGFNVTLLLPLLLTDSHTY